MRTRGRRRPARHFWQRRNLGAAGRRSRGRFRDRGRDRDRVGRRPRRRRNAKQFCIRLAVVLVALCQKVDAAIERRLERVLGRIGEETADRVRAVQAVLRRCRAAEAET